MRNMRQRDETTLFFTECVNVLTECVNILIEWNRYITFGPSPIRQEDYADQFDQLSPDHGQYILGLRGSHLNH